MPVYFNDVDKTTGDVYDFNANGQLAYVKAGVTVVDEIDNVFYNSSYDEETVVNYGTIQGCGTAIELAGGDGYDQVSNYGYIGGGAGTNGVYIGSVSSVVMNAGTIFGPEAGVTLAGMDDTLDNSGTITCPEGQGQFGARAAVKCSSNDIAITNHGTIEGDILFTASSGTVRNAGTIDGNVTFALGSNVYDGRGGFVDGTITGGLGSDTITAGSHGDTIAGGRGHDYIHAGAGADTFILNSASGADWDRIWHFDVAHDTIELDHSALTALSADTTPTFAIASSATSASDHLYYNSSNGYLYYDRDGSDTHYNAIVIAHLDHGLKLTAADFTVI